MFISLASVAAFVCATVVFFLMVQINRTRLTLQADGVVEFNYIQQNDHNFDILADAPRRLPRGAARADPDAPRDFIARFDIVWSALGVSDAHWTGSLQELPDTAALITDKAATSSRGTSR